MKKLICYNEFTKEETELLTEVLSNNISKQVVGTLDSNKKIITKKIIYKFKIPKAGTQVAFIFDIFSNNDVSIRFGKIDISNILTQNSKYYIDDFKFISSIRQQCIDDFLKNYTECKNYIL